MSRNESSLKLISQLWREISLEFPSPAPHGVLEGHVTFITNNSMMAGAYEDVVHAALILYLVCLEEREKGKETMRIEFHLESGAERSVPRTRYL